MRCRLAFLMTIVLMFFAACESEYSARCDQNGIAFSTDTLKLDTIFAGDRSTLNKLLIYNKSGENIIIEKIRLRGGEKSLFNVNINGKPGVENGDIRMRSGDSLYVFVNAFPPEKNDAIYTIDDDIDVCIGGNTWTSHLTAYAMNVIHVKGRIEGDVIWKGELPYLLSGIVEIDSAASLTVEAGTQILMADNAQLNIYGSMTTKGENENMVTIRASRLDSFYDDIPGQWKGIKLMAGSGKAELKYTKIAHATRAIEVDSATTLALDKSIICDASMAGIVSYAAKTHIDGSLLYNCGGPLVEIYGGTIDIHHCTLSNNFKWKSRIDSSVKIAGGENLPKIEHIEIANSIIVGNVSNEIHINAEDADSTNFIVSHCYVHLGNKHTLNEDWMKEVEVGSKPLFVDIKKFDFHPSKESPFINKGDAKYAADTTTDFDGNDRQNDDAPDLGAFEYIPQNEEQ